MELDPPINIDGLKGWLVEQSVPMTRANQIFQQVGEAFGKSVYAANWPMGLAADLQNIVLEEWRAARRVTIGTRAFIDALLQFGFLEGEDHSDLIAVSFWEAEA